MDRHFLLHLIHRGPKTDIIKDPNSDLNALQCRAFFVGGYSKLELDQKIDAAKANPLADVGEIGNGRKDESRVDNVSSTKGGNDTDYTLRRLARDQPELLDEIKSGALSVNAAAIKAGIRASRLDAAADSG